MMILQFLFRLSFFSFPCGRSLSPTTTKQTNKQTQKECFFFRVSASDLHMWTNYIRFFFFLGFSFDTYFVLIFINNWMEMPAIFTTIWWIVIQLRGEREKKMKNVFFGSLFHCDNELRFRWAQSHRLLS